MNRLADAVSAALLHSLWQDASVALVLAIGLVALRQRSANARYLAACVALATMTALPLITGAVRYVAAAPPIDGHVIRSEASPIRMTNERPRDVVAAPTPARSAWLIQARQWAFPCWIAGVLLFSLRLAGAGANILAIRRRSGAADAAMANAVARLAARIGITRPIRVLAAAANDGPATIGWLRPLILVPTAAALNLTAAQLEALIAHELAHIRRHDYIVNLLQLVVETLLFYHPAVWWVSRRIRIERELCCDDIVVEACGNPFEYARALTRVAQLRVASAQMALAAGGGPLLRRIQRVLGVHAVSATPSPLWTIAIVIAAFALTLTAVRAQSPLPGVPTPAAQREAVLKGHVTDTLTGEPIPGAKIALRSGNPVPRELRTGRIYRVATDASGGYEVRGIAAGEYLVQLRAEGFLRPEDAPRQIVTSTVRVPAVKTTTADFSLTQAGVITGRVVLSDGKGMAGAEVELLRRQYLPGGARPVPIVFAQTEDGGAFRLRGIPPGEYYLRAYTLTSVHPARARSTEIYASTFYPDATELDGAQPLVIGAGQELSGFDVSLAAVKTHSISGMLIDPDGAPLTTARVELMPRPTGTLDTPQSGVAANGQFRLTGIAPGTYSLSVADTIRGRHWNSAPHQIAVLADVKDLVIVAASGVRVDGRVVREGGQPVPFDPTNLMVSLIQQDDTGETHGLGSARIGSNAHFSFDSAAGRVSARVLGVYPGWHVKQILLDGYDVTDVAFDLRTGARRRLEIVVSDHAATLAGTVTDRNGHSVENAVVIVYPDNQALWRSGRLTRRGFSYQGGQYVIDDIPTEDYRAVAVAALPRDAWLDAAVLERLWADSTPIHLDNRERRVVPLKVVAAPQDLLQ